MSEQRLGHQMPDGTMRFVSASRRRCCSWVLVGCGSVLLLIGVTLFVFGLAPSGRALWSQIKWLGVACGGELKLQNFIIKILALYSRL